MIHGKGGDCMNALIKLRKEKNIKQKEMSKMLGIANSTYSLYETNKSLIPYNIAKSISEFFEVELNQIFLPTKFMIQE